MLGEDEATVSVDSGGEVFVVDIWGGDGESRGEQSGFLWMKPCQVSWFGPHVDGAIAIDSSALHILPWESE